MKRIYIIVIYIATLIVLTSCKSAPEFVLLDNGNIADQNGIEYEYLAREGSIVTFGKKTFMGRIKGEKAYLEHLGGMFKTGMYFSEGDIDLRILRRTLPDSEWTSFYRKASLPELDFSIDSVVRLELIRFKDVYAENGLAPGIEHLTCNEGIKTNDEIENFLEDVRNQQSPIEAGLYDLVKRPDGKLENCYGYGYVYGFVKDEPNLAIPLQVMSFDDKAYSIRIEGKDYVLPEKWLEALTAK